MHSRILALGLIAALGCGVPSAHAGIVDILFGISASTIPPMLVKGDKDFDLCKGFGGYAWAPYLRKYATNYGYSYSKAIHPTNKQLRQWLLDSRKKTAGQLYADITAVIKHIEQLSDREFTKFADRAYLFMLLEITPLQYVHSNIINRADAIEAVRQVYSMLLREHKGRKYFQYAEKILTKATDKQFQEVFAKEHDFALGIKQLAQQMES